MISSAFPKKADFSSIVGMTRKPFVGESRRGLIGKLVIHQTCLPRNDLAKIHSGRIMIQEFKMSWVKTIAKKPGSLFTPGNCR